MNGETEKGAPAGASRRLFDLLTLRLLVAAIEEGNLARVAERENISLSSVSRRISDLEARSGVRLLHRHDRGVTATDASLAIIGKLRGAQRLLDQAVVDLDAFREGGKGMVRIRAHLSAVAGDLPVRIAAFQAKHPGIGILLEEGTSREIVHAVQVGDCDVGLVSSTIEATTAMLLPWSTDRLVVIMPRGHPLEARSSLAFADLVDLPFIGMSRLTALQTLFRGQAALLDKQLDERANIGTFEGVRMMVAAGLGIGILPEATALRSGGGEGVSVRPLAEAWANRSLMIAIRGLDELSTASRLFVDHLRSADPGPT